MFRIAAVFLLSLRLSCGRRVHETKAVAGVLGEDIVAGKSFSNTTTIDLASAKEAALKRLDGFKAEVLEALGTDQDLVTNFGNRDDKFYLRFLVFNELHEKGKKPGNALKMLMNYAKFITMCRAEGFLTGLGAEAIRPYMNKGFVRMMSTRDKMNRRMVLTAPDDMDSKVPEYWRTRMYLYIILKLMTFEDTMEPGVLVMHDFTGVTLTSIAKRLTGKSDAQKMLVDNTFPWILSKVLFVNTEWKLRAGFSVITSIMPKSVAGNIEYNGGTSLAEKYIDRAALPAGPPYDGEVEESWDAGLSPGLGVFFEPEMDSQENM